jgi:hypothetical protein
MVMTIVYRRKLQLFGDTLSPATDSTTQVRAVLNSAVLPWDQQCVCPGCPGKIHIPSILPPTPSQALDRACLLLTLANIGLQMIGMAWGLALQLRPLRQAVAFMWSQSVERAQDFMHSTTHSMTSAAGSVFCKLELGSKRQAGAGE